MHSAVLGASGVADPDVEASLGEKEGDGVVFVVDHPGMGVRVEAVLDEDWRESANSLLLFLQKIEIWSFFKFQIKFYLVDLNDPFGEKRDQEKR